MGETCAPSVIHEDSQGGPGGILFTPDGIPPGWGVSYQAGKGWLLSKLKPKPHWSEKLGPWPDRRPSSILHHIDFQDKVVFITGSGGRRLLGIPFSHIETIYNEVSRL